MRAKWADTPSISVPEAFSGGKLAGGCGIDEVLLWLANREENPLLSIIPAKILFKKTAK